MLNFLSISGEHLQLRSGRYVIIRIKYRNNNFYYDLYIEDDEHENRDHIIAMTENELSNNIIK